MAVFGIEFNSSNLYYKILPMEEAAGLYISAPSYSDWRSFTDSRGSINSGQRGGLPFVDSYSADGKLIFQKNIAVSWVPGKSPYRRSYGNIQSVTRSDDGSIYITGTATGNIFSKDTYAGGVNDAFLAKLGPSGDVEWTSIMNTPSIDGGGFASVDSSGYIYWAGEVGGRSVGAWEGSVDGNSLTHWIDIFIRKFNTKGELVGSAIVGGKKDDWNRVGVSGPPDHPKDLVISKDGVMTLVAHSQAQYSDIDDPKFAIQISSIPFDPIYSIVPSASSSDEGGHVRTNVTTTGVAEGTQLYWSLGGTGIDADDFSSGDLLGSRLVQSDGTLTFTHTLAADKATEGTESLEIKLFSDGARKTQVGDTATVSILDTSIKPKTPTYSLSPSTSSIDEKSQSSVRFNISTTNVDANTRLYYTASGSGVTASDFSSGDIKSSGLIGSDGKASFLLSAAADKTTEETESFNVKLYSDYQRTNLVATSSSVSIADTSKSPIPTYSLSISPRSIDEGDAFRASITTTQFYPGTRLYYAIKGDLNSSDIDDGQLTGSVSLNNSGSASFTRRATKDLLTEGPEAADVLLYTDSQRTLQVGDTASLNIRDTSKTPKKAAYSIAFNPSPLKEGDLLSSSITTKNLEPGTTIHWALSGSGIDSADFSAGSLQGKNNLSKSGAFSLTHAIAQDLTTEGKETLKLQLFSDPERNNLLSQKSIAIADTSITPQSASLLSTSVDGNNLSLTFDSQLDNSKPDHQRFSITADGKPIAIKSSSLNAKAGSLSLKLAAPIRRNQDVQLTYTDLKSNQSTGVLQTPNGTDLPSFSTAVVNTTSDNTPPSITDAYANSKTLSLSFSEPIAQDLPSKRSWTFKQDGKAIAITDLSIDSLAAQLNLTLKKPLDRATDLTLSYNDLSGNQKSNVLQDLAGNDLPSFSNLALENRTTRSSDPLNVNTAEIDGDEITLAFDRELSNTTPSKGTFRISANGKAIKLNRILLYPDDREAVLNLAKPVAHNDQVSLSYTDAKGDQKKNIIQDVDGNDLASLNSLPLTNNTRKNPKQFNIDYADAYGTTINLYLTASLSSSIPKTSRFRITANRRRQLISSIDSQRKDGLVTLNLRRPIKPSQDILISYRDLSGDQSTGIIEDDDGNDLPSFSNLSPLNDAFDSDPPSLEDAYLDRKELILEFDELLQPGKLQSSRFKVRANNNKRIRLASATIPQDDAIAILNLKSPLPFKTKSLSISYRDLKADQSSLIIQDIAGNDLPSLRNFPVEIISGNNNFTELA